LLFRSIKGDVHIKKVDRSSFLTEVAAEHSLNHVETTDKSAPAIDGAHVQKSAMPAVLSEIASKK
jgi:hypothetical protein